MDLNTTANPGSIQPGSKWAATIPDALSQAREDAIYQAFCDGNVPDFMKTFVEVTTSYQAPDGSQYSCVFWTLPDYLCVGIDTDFIRTPLNPHTAQRIGNLWGCVLPTRLMVNAIWKQSITKISPHPIPPDAAMTSTHRFVVHNAIVQSQLQGIGFKPGTLLGGHKKDVVICLDYNPKKVAIYGWHQLNGIPIQGPGIQSSFHEDTYADYSHGVRMVRDIVNVNGQDMSMEDVLQDSTLCHLLSDEGPLQTTRFAV